MRYSSNRASTTTNHARQAHAVQAALPTRPHPLHPVHVSPVQELPPSTRAFRLRVLRNIIPGLGQLLLQLELRLAQLGLARIQLCLQAHRITLCLLPTRVQLLQLLCCVCPAAAGFQLS